MTTTYSTPTTTMMSMARDMVETHLPGWTVEWDRAKSRWGCCHFALKKITFSLPLFSINGIEEFEKTLIHEVAHGLAGHKAGHGPQWAAVVRSLGGVPQRCRTAPVQPETNYTGKCGCGVRAKRDRKSATMFRLYCTKCKIVLKWYDKSGKLVPATEAPAPRRRQTRRYVNTNWSF